MKTLKLIIVSLLIVIFVACTGSEYVIQNRGDIAEVKVLNNTIPRNEISMNIELVIVTDTSIVGEQFVDNIPIENQIGRIIEIPFNNIKELEIRGYSNSDWIWPVIFLQVVPAIVLTITALTVNEGNAVIIAPLLLPAVITAAVFGASDEETPTFKGETLFIEKDRLKRYAKYPNGLSNENFERILSSHDQTQAKLIK